VGFGLEHRLLPAGQSPSLLQAVFCMHDDGSCKLGLAGASEPFGTAELSVLVPCQAPERNACSALRDLTTWLRLSQAC
jgi:hypothetical protein